MKRIISIAGGGVSGLLIAYFLKKKGVRFRVFEASGRTGGLLGSVKEPWGLAERSANGLIMSELIETICDDLDLEIKTPLLDSKKRYLVRNDELQTFPLYFSDVFRIFFGLFKKPKASFQTVFDFGNYFFGQSLSKEILQTGLMGIYGATADELSFPAIFRSLSEDMNEKKRPFFSLGRFIMNRKAGKKYKGTYSFQGGMQEFIDGLSQYLKDDIELNCSIDHWPQKETTVICTPAYRAAEILKETSLYASLKEAEYASMISVTVCCRKADFKQWKEGFGCLISRKSGYQMLGILFNHHIFEERVTNNEFASLTCIFRDFDGELKSKTDEELTALIAAELNQLFGFDGEFVGCKIFRWPQGIPIYSPQLYENWSFWQKECDESYKNLYLLGNYTGQISIRGICENAHRLAERIAEG